MPSSIWAPSMIKSWIKCNAHTLLRSMSYLRKNKCISFKIAIAEEMAHYVSIKCSHLKSAYQQCSTETNNILRYIIQIRWVYRRRCLCRSFLRHRPRLRSHLHLLHGVDQIQVDSEAREYVVRILKGQVQFQGYGCCVGQQEEGDEHHTGRPHRWWIGMAFDSCNTPFVLRDHLTLACFSSPESVIP